MFEDSPFIGKGWGFLPAFNKVSGSVELLGGVTDINSSLEILLSTRPGERVMQPNYGCNLDILLFEPITTSLITYVEELIRTAIIYFEPRIDPLNILLDTSGISEGRIIITVTYKVRNNNSRFNFVFPFYLNEAPDQ